MFLGLRLLDGLDVAEASARMGIDLAARYRTQLNDLVEVGLLEREDTVFPVAPLRLPDSQPGIHAVPGLTGKTHSLGRAPTLGVGLPRVRQIPLPSACQCFT